MAMSERGWERYERDQEKGRVSSQAKAREKRLVEAAGLGGQRLSPEVGKLIAVAVTGGAGALVVYALYRVASSSSDGSKATATAGSTLTVKTPKKTPGVLRSAAGLASPQVALVPNGTAVQVTGEAVTFGKRWYPVSVPGGKVGWMSEEILA